MMSEINSILDYAQIAFVSAKEGTRLRTLFPYINEASETIKTCSKFYFK